MKQSLPGRHSASHGIPSLDQRALHKIVVHENLDGFDAHIAECLLLELSNQLMDVNAVHDFHGDLARIRGSGAWGCGAEELQFFPPEVRKDLS